MEGPLKKSPAGRLLLWPADHGWRLADSDRILGSYATLAEAAAALPPGGTLTLAVPGALVLLERLTLPSTDPAEIAGMVLLQLEKTLPYPVEETTHGFQIIRTAEGSATVVTVAIPAAQLEALAEPLRSQLPARVAPWPMQLASAAPGDRPGAILYREQGRLYLVVCEQRALSYLQPLGAENAEELAAELPQILLAAELEGVPMDWEWLLVADDCSALAPAMFDASGLTPRPLTLPRALPDPPVSLVPASWQEARSRHARRGRWRERAILAGAAYVVALLLLGGWLVVLNLQARNLQKRIIAAGTEVDFLLAREKRWNTLIPAVDPSRFLVEMLYQINSSLPSPDIRITLYQQAPDNFSLKGEAPTYDLALDFVERLKANPELAGVNFTAPNPDILPNEHASFSISGKL